MIFGFRDIVKGDLSIRLVRLKRSALMNCSRDHCRIVAGGVMLQPLLAKRFYRKCMDGCPKFAKIGTSI